MDKFVERRKAFKSSGITARPSQESRRVQALEEQKKRRALSFDASRQLDQFADLSLSASDDEVSDEDFDVHSSEKRLASLSPALRPDDAAPPPESRSPSPFIDPTHASGEKRAKRKKKRKGKNKQKPSAWANKCMYAELLEMKVDSSWPGSWDTAGGERRDGLPDDLDVSWVGLAPVPVGKRCLAVTMQSAGVSGVVPNTVLRSRLLGKVIIQPFPSPLPPNTILDCILDENWRSNGLLHVLDVVRWKSQDLGSCEASFRFWWRDTRISEIMPHHSPEIHNSSPSTNRTRSEHRYRYPTTFVPVPYKTPLPYEHILGELLHLARYGRRIHLKVPVLNPELIRHDNDMDVDQGSHSFQSTEQVENTEIPITSDGLLLYVGEASYESGESPLSVWVPRLSPHRFEREHEQARQGSSKARASLEGDLQESPLDNFERLIRRRLVARDIGLREVGVCKEMET